MKNLILITGFILAACSVYRKVDVTVLPEADFKTYRTFAWLKDITDTTASEFHSAIIRNNIRNYFGKELVKRGYDFDPDSPDVLLQLIIHSKRKTEEVKIIQDPKNQAGNYFQGSDYYFPYRNSYLYNKSNVYCYPEGYCIEKMDVLEESISLRVIDRKSNLLVWSATAAGDVYDPGQIKRSIHPAVIAIMKKYPGSK